MLALGAFSASLGELGVWLGLAIGVPVVCWLWWAERSRWVARRRIKSRAAFELVDADLIRLTYDGFLWSQENAPEHSVAWSDVRGIAAFVEAHGDADTLVLALRAAPDAKWIAFLADSDGFDLLRLALKERFGVPIGWEESVWRGPNGLNWRRLWGHAPPPGEVCWRCNYDLHGNESGVCPECGTAFVWPEPSRTNSTATDVTDAHR